MTLRHKSFAALALSLVALAPVRAQDPFAAVRDTIRQILEAQKIPSVAVAVAKGNRILWEEAFGYADVDKKIPATVETMYSLASISKPFTATGLMRLVERKSVDINRPANDYLGTAKLRSFEGDAAEITVRRVLSHTAGLPLHYQFFYEGNRAAHSYDEAIAQYGFAGYPPGTAYFYSNLGYGIIDYIIARTSRRSYEEYMRREVFEPLDLRHTTVSTGKDLGKRAAIRYSADLKPFLPYGFDHTGGSGVWSSVHDLVRFGMFHLGAKLPKQKEIINADSRAAMQRPEAPVQGQGSSYGLGWALLADDNSYQRVQHTGGMPGVATMLNLYPSDSVVIVVLFNRDNIGAAMNRIATAMASVALPRYAATREARRTGQAARGGTVYPPQVTQLTILPLPAPSGLWRGFAIVGRDSVAVSLDYSGGTPRIQIGTDSARTLTNVSSSNGWYSGNVRVPLRLPDAAPSSETGRNAATVSLRLHGSSMRGWISSLSQGPPNYGAVSYRLELGKQ
jgi:CubicO group peptidase (beta-lactamase class C family)